MPFPFRYRLIDPEGNDLGPFVSGYTSWQPGATLRLPHGRSGLFRVTAVVEPEEDDDFLAYLVLDETFE